MADVSDKSHSTSAADTSFADSSFNNAAMGKSPENVSPQPSEVKSPNKAVDKSSESPAPEPSEAPKRLFNRQKTIHEVLGGGKAADVLLWRRRGICIALLVAGGTVWYLFEQSGYSALSVVAVSLLLFLSILFSWANAASLLQRPLPPLPELTLSEETVIRAAAKVCATINFILAIAHDIAVGKDIKLFGKVIISLWLLSVLGGWFNFLTLSYICLILCLSVPVLYNMYEDRVDRNAEIAYRHIAKCYRSLDEIALSKIRKRLSHFSNISKDCLSNVSKHKTQ